MTTSEEVRAAFERWASAAGFDMTHYEICCYGDPTQQAWAAWQAAASIYAKKLPEWQPIATAPKDGAAYLGVIKVYELYAEPFIAHYDLDEGGHCCKYQTEPVLHRPTHWMPLPAPPVALMNGE